MNNIQKILGQTSILPVLTVESPEEAVELSRALLRGGIKAVEITLRTAAALESLAAVKQELPEMIVAAGTVLTAQDAIAVKRAGVDFAVSPATSTKLYDAVDEVGLLFLPGVATPGEVLKGLEREYEYFKLFPAVAVGGLSLLKSLSAPLAKAKFCPTGGLNQTNFCEFLALPNVFCVGGSWMVPTDKVRGESWDEITLLAEAANAALSG